MTILKRHAQRLGVFALAVLLSACSAGAGGVPYLSAPQTDSYTLVAGDELKINVPGLEALEDVTIAVGDNGMLSLPLLGDVPAAGKSPDQVEANVRQVLLERQILVDPFVDVQALEMRPFYILGEVNKPGEYKYRPGMSAIAAVSVAGGFTYRANQQTILVTRQVDGRKVDGQINPADPIRPGDQITVLERWF